MGINKVRDHQGRERIQVSKYWPDGSRFRRYSPNMTVAKKLMARIDEAVVMGTWPELKEALSRERPDKEVTVAEFSEIYLREYCRVQNRRPEFKEQALVSINRILGEVAVAQVTRVHAHRFRTARSEEGRAPATVNRGMAVLKHMLSFGVEKEVIADNPLRGFKKLPEEEKALQVMTLEEERRLVECVSTRNPTVGAMVGLMGETGLRRAEAMRLRWEQVSLDRKQLTVARSKSGRVRHIPLTGFAIEYLRSVVRVIGSPFCFVKLDTGQPYKQPRHALFKGKEQAGLNWVGFHDLRHFRASQWVMNGVDLRTVQGLLGHSSITTTMRYAHFAPDHADRAVLESEKRELATLQQAKNRRTALEA